MSVAKVHYAWILMFGFVDFRWSPVIRLFPSVADAHQTSAFRAWTMGEPYTTFEELQRPQHASFTAIEREAAIMRGNSLSYALVPITTRDTSWHRSYLEKHNHICIQDPNDFHDNALIILLAGALPWASFSGRASRWNFGGLERLHLRLSSMPIRRSSI